MNDECEDQAEPAALICTPLLATCLYEVHRRLPSLCYSSTPSPDIPPSPCVSSSVCLDLRPYLTASVPLSPQAHAEWDNAPTKAAKIRENKSEVTEMMTASASASDTDNS